MISPAQIQYLEQVLGTSLRHFSSSEISLSESKTQPTSTAVNLLAISPDADTAQLALRGKILASVGIQDCASSTETVNQLGEWPMNMQKSRNVLLFSAKFPAGRHDVEGVSWWVMPSLQEMLGSGPQVTEKKKITWAVMQKFSQERPQ